MSKNILKNKIKNNTLEAEKVQERQDNIFRNMSADRKVEIGSQLWRLAKDLVGDKISYRREDIKG
tara:strand:+ start:85 stop:279 length:195 start_codon:yes stop_codon:yes gene_type:complete